jgi:hypothetical protein
VEPRRDNEHEFARLIRGDGAVAAAYMDAAPAGPVAIRIPILTLNRRDG